MGKVWVGDTCLLLYWNILELKILMNRQIAILLVSMLFIACGNKQEKSETVTSELMPSQIVGIGKVVPNGGIVNLAAPTSGIVNEIYVNAGDTVKKGNLILTLNSTDEELHMKSNSVC